MSKPIDWSRPLQTRDGRKARLLGVINSKPFSHVVAVECRDVEETRHHTPSGSYWETIYNSDYDLINAPERIKREYWVNVYPSGALSWFNSKESAAFHSGSSVQARVKVVIECNEGEGL
jgi:hypothetical protein